MFLNLELSEIGITEVGFSDIPIRDSVGGGGLESEGNRAREVLEDLVAVGEG